MTEKSMKITLGELSDGAAEELFGRAVQDVARNMADHNTSWRDKREVVLRFTFSQDEDRKLGEVDIRCSTKLAGVRGIKRPLYIGTHMGVPTYREGPKQDDLFTQPKGGPRSVPATEGGAA